jgi:hypothetical protein
VSKGSQLIFESIVSVIRVMWKLHVKGYGGKIRGEFGVGVLGFCGCGVLKVQGAWAFCLSGFHGKTSERISCEDS